MGMGFAPTWLHQVSPLLHMSILTTVSETFSDIPRKTQIYPTPIQAGNFVNYHWLESTMIYQMV